MVCVIYWCFVLLGLLRCLLLVFDFFWLVRCVIGVCCFVCCCLHAFLLALLRMVLLVLWFALMQVVCCNCVTVCGWCCRVNSVVVCVLIVWVKALYCAYFGVGIVILWWLVYWFGVVLDVTSVFRVLLSECLLVIVKCWCLVGDVGF